MMPAAMPVSRQTKITSSMGASHSATQRGDNLPLDRWVQCRHPYLDLFSSYGAPWLFSIGPVLRSHEQPNGNPNENGADEQDLH